MQNSRIFLAIVIECTPLCRAQRKLMNFAINFFRRHGYASFLVATVLSTPQVLISPAYAQSPPPSTGMTGSQSTTGSSAHKQKSGGRKAPAPTLPTLPTHARDFVIARGLELWRGQYEFTNIGVNIPDLFVRFLNNDDKAATAVMKEAAKAGVRFVRCDGCTRSPEEFHRFISDSAGWLTAFQRMLSAADDLGISIVPTLLPNIRMIPTYISSIGSPAVGSAPNKSSISDYLKMSTPSNSLALKYIDAVVGRFRDDPRVLFWELGDEYNLGADLPESNGVRGAAECFSSDEVRSFLIQTSKHIKGIDRNHLVSSGNTDMRPNSWHLRQAMLDHRTAADKWAYTVSGLATDSDTSDSDSSDNFAQYSEMIHFFSPPGIDLVSVHASPPGESQVGWLVEDDDHALRLPWSQLAAGSVPGNAAEAPAGKPIFIGAFGQPSHTSGNTQLIAWTVDFVRRIRTGPSSLCALDRWQSGESSPGPAGNTNDLANQVSSANLALLTAALAAPYNK